MPQLLEIISAFGSPENFQSWSLFSNPADHNQPYTVSPNHKAFTGKIFASGATPIIEYFFVLL